MLKENCTSCLQPITNPICEACFIRQIDSWLKSIDFTAMSREKIISKLISNKSPESLNEQECIVCGQAVDICSYCFVLKTSKLFKRTHLTEEFIQNFQAIFSYCQNYA